MLMWRRNMSLRLTSLVNACAERYRLPASEFEQPRSVHIAIKAKLA